MGLIQLPQYKDFGKEYCLRLEEWLKEGVIQVSNSHTLVFFVFGGLMLMLIALLKSLRRWIAFHLGSSRFKVACTG